MRVGIWQEECVFTITLQVRPAKDLPQWVLAMKGFPDAEASHVLGLG